MAVMARETWTDERLGDLNQRVDEGFKETREEFRAVRSEMRSEFQAVRVEMKGEFQAMRRSEASARLRAVVQLTWGLIGTMLAGFLGIAATLLVTL
jgi:hypothetical protein